VKCGHYTEAVPSDKHFRNREPHRYCTERGIRLSGSQLKRPLKNLDPEWLKQKLADNSARNTIKEKFGQCNRCLSMGRVMARLRTSSETVIAVTILVANLIRWEQDIARLYWVMILPRFLITEMPNEF